MTTDNQQTRAAAITGAIREIRDSIRQAELSYDRHQDSVSLLAVSKTRPASDIVAAIDAGQLEFGENYVDEGVGKIQDINASLPQAVSRTLHWHFIGSIQSNKTKLIANHFSWVHGIDRLRIADRLAKQRSSELPALNCCIQVNVDDEASKAGVSVSELGELVAACSELPNLTLRGLMAIPAPRDTVTGQRQVFAQIRALLSDLQQTHPQLDTLSMGMTADRDAAIAEGATIVRVGTAIFGARQKSV